MAHTINKVEFYYIKPDDAITFIIINDSKLMLPCNLYNHIELIELLDGDKQVHPKRIREYSCVIIGCHCWNKRTWISIEYTGNNRPTIGHFIAYYRFNCVNEYNQKFEDDFYQKCDTRDMILDEDDELEFYTNLEVKCFMFSKSDMHQYPDSFVLNNRYLFTPSVDYMQLVKNLNIWFERNNIAFETRPVKYNGKPCKCKSSAMCNCQWCLYKIIGKNHPKLNKIYTDCLSNGRIWEPPDDFDSDLPPPVSEEEEKKHVNIWKRIVSIFGR